MIFYVSIGNSDDKLTQSRWQDFIQDVQDALSDEVSMFHGQWFSEPRSAFQNACWCIELDDALDHRVLPLKGGLRRIASEYGQESIAWAPAPYTEFLSGVSN